MKRWSRREFLRRVGGASVSAALAGGAGDLLAACSPGNAGSTASATARRGGHVVEAVVTDVKTLNPVLVADTNSSRVAGLLYDSLLTSRANGDLIPWLARDPPKTSQDGLTYTVTLRDGLKFSDGSPLTADDVKFTYDLMFDPAYRAVNSPRRTDLETYVGSIDAPDPRTIIFRLTKTYAPFAVSQLGYGVLPKKQWGSLPPKAVNASELNTAPTITSGAWTFASWQKGQQLTLTANRAHWAGSPYLDSYVYKSVADSAAVIDQLKTGEADFAALDPSQLAALHSNPDVSIVSFPVASFTFCAFNQNSATPLARTFQEKTVRQALLLALDRKGMAEAITFGQAVVADSVEPPVGWAYNPDTKPRFGHDPAKAESMLDAAGYRKGADGIRVGPTGQRLAFTLITIAGAKVFESLAVAMQDEWRKIGVECTPKPVQFAQLVGQITNQRSFDAVLVGFAWNQDPDQSVLWHSRSTAPGGFNGFGFRSSEADRLLDAGVATVDQAQRRKIYFQFQDLMADLSPAPILFFNKGLWGFSKRMRGYDDPQLGIGTYTQYSRPWMSKVWVTDGK